MLLVSKELRRFAAETIIKNIVVFNETAFNEFKVYYPNDVYFIIRYWHKDKCFVASCPSPNDHSVEVRKDVDKETATSLIEQVLPNEISNDIWIHMVEGFCFLTINTTEGQ